MADSFVSLYDWIMDLNDLDITNKVLLARIYDLAKTDDGCYASNSFFAEYLGINPTNTSKRVSKLVELGYITITIKNRTSRTIKTTGKKVSSETTNQVCRKRQRGMSQKTNPIVNNDKPTIVADDKGDCRERQHNIPVEHTNVNKPMEHTIISDQYNIPHFEVGLLLAAIEENIKHERAKDLILRKLAGEDFTPTMVEEFTKYYGMYFTINKLKEIITNENSTGT